MNAFVCDHTFKITLSQTKFEALVTKACRAPFAVEIIAHDPGVVPALRLFTVFFSTPEDRDRVRIAMRFLEKEQAAMHAAGTSRTQPVTSKLARA
jgi:hypothetical protein